MRFFSGANRLERLRRRAVAAGELIDVTQDARALGLHETVCVSKRLWQSLIQPYPFAQPDDCLPLSRLLYLLKVHLRTSKPAPSSVLVVVIGQFKYRHLWAEWAAGVDDRWNLYDWQAVVLFLRRFPALRRDGFSPSGPVGGMAVFDSVTMRGTACAKIVSACSGSAMEPSVAES